MWSWMVKVEYGGPSGVPVIVEAFTPFDIECESEQQKATAATSVCGQAATGRQER